MILHYWAIAVDATAVQSDIPGEFPDPEPVQALQTAYEQTTEATGKHDWQGTTTTCGAQLHYLLPEGEGLKQREPSPVLYVTNLGDCQIMVIRPRDQEVIYKTKEQWHWFDCPRQLGTNSPDTPKENAVMDTVDLEVGDVVLAMTDGVIDNLWEHEIVDTVLTSIRNWESNKITKDTSDRRGGRNGGMKAAAQDLVAAAQEVATDPFAESPFMEHAIEEGLASEGGKT